MFWDNGSNELEEALAGITAEALADARSRSGGDAGRAIDLLLEDCGGQSDKVRALLFVRELHDRPLPQATPRASIAFIHLMAGEAIQWAGLARRVINMLASIQKEFEPEEEMRSYLVEQARKIVMLAAEATLAKGAAIITLLDGSHYRVMDGDVVVEPDVRVALDRVLTALSGDGRALWEFRNGLSEGREEFDRAVAGHWSELSRAVSDATLSLFRSGARPGPSEYIGTFTAAFDELALLERIIDELAWRQGLRDGFTGGSDGAEWLKVVASFRAWTPKHLRKLALLEDLLRGESSAMLAAIRVGVSCLWDIHRAEAVYGALTLLRHARRLKEWRKQLVDADEERECLGFVRSLPDGAAVVAVRDKWESLPIASGGAPRAWGLLSDRAKDVWRARLASELMGKPDMAKGVVEFALSWAPKEVFADLERTIIALVAEAGADAHLQTIAGSGDGVAALRAEALIQHLQLGQPS